MLENLYYLSTPYNALTLPYLSRNSVTTCLLCNMLKKKKDIQVETTGAVLELNTCNSWGSEGTDFSTLINIAQYTHEREECNVRLTKLSRHTD